MKAFLIDMKENWTAIVCGILCGLIMVWATVSVFDFMHKVCAIVDHSYEAIK